MWVARAFGGRGRVALSDEKASACKPGPGSIERGNRRRRECPAQAQCPAHNCRYFFQPTLRNQWGYGGLVQTWGLGGPAMAPWNGGAIVGVTPYGPNPYDHVKPNGRLSAAD